MLCGLHLQRLSMLDVHTLRCSLANVEWWPWRSEIIVGQGTVKVHSIFSNSCFPDKVQCLWDQKFLSSNYSVYLQRHWGAKMIDPESPWQKNNSMFWGQESNTKSVSPIWETDLWLLEGSFRQASLPSFNLSVLYFQWVSKKRSQCFLPLRRESGFDKQGLSTAVLTHALVLATLEAKTGGWLQPRV